MATKDAALQRDHDVVDDAVEEEATDSNIAIVACNIFVPHVEVPRNRLRIKPCPWSKIEIRSIDRRQRHRCRVTDPMWKRNAATLLD